MAKRSNKLGNEKLDKLSTKQIKLKIPKRKVEKTPNQQEYEKQIRRIKQAEHRNIQRGYLPDYTLPEKPSKITKKFLDKLKSIKPSDLRKESTYVDRETGSILEGAKAEKLNYHKRAEKSAKTRKANAGEKTNKNNNKGKQEQGKQNKQKTGEKYNEEQGYLPNGGGIVFDNVLTEFINKLSEPTREFNDFGKKRYRDAYEQSERQRTTLLSLTYYAVSRDGKEAVGWRLQGAGDELESLLYYVLYGSDSTSIQSASHELAEIINGSTLSMKQLMDLEEESEANESFEPPE